MEEIKYKEYLDHFSKELSPEIKQYATEAVFDFSRYIFYCRQGKEQHGYCTHCRTEFQTSNLKHNEETECPNCKSRCYAKNSKLGRKKMFDRSYFVYYEKSIINPEVVVARGIYVSRDYRGDYNNVDTRYFVEALYVFEMSKSVLLEHYYGSFCKQKSVYSLFSRYHNDGWMRRDVKTVSCHKSIEKAVKGTPFQYSCWDDYAEGDFVKFFDLYSKYPCVEYLTKLGFDDLVIDKLIGRNTYGAINWRGKTLLEVLRLSKKDLNEIKTSKISIDSLTLRLLQISKKDGSNLTINELELISRNHYTWHFKDLQKVLKHTTIRKADRYINKQFANKNKDNRYYGKDQVLITWKDYIADCIKLEMDLKQENVLFPSDLHNAHQHTIKQVKEKDNEVFNKKISLRAKSLSKYRFEHLGLVIRPAVSSKELIEEGTALNHCVGRYAERYANGETDILLVRKTSEPDKPYFTVEVQKNKIIQVSGNKNCSPGKEVSDFIEEFKKKKLTKKKDKVAIAV